MAYIIDIKPGMTPRELIRRLEHGFESYMDMPLSFVDAIHGDCDECDSGEVIRMKIALSDGLELRIFYR